MGIAVKDRGTEIIKIIVCSHESALAGLIEKGLPPGFESIFTRRIESAKSVLCSVHASVAVIDLSGLGNAGLQMIQEIRRAAPDVKIITISEPGRVSMSIELMKTGVFADLTYPLSINDLCGRIKEAAVKESGEKRRSKFFDMVQDTLLAAAFAESGDHETARKIIGTRKTKHACPARAMEEEMSDRKIKILLVDDEREFVNTLSERIRMRELGADIAFDGEQALELVSNEIPDVMVLDLRMPGIDGMEVLRRVKKEYPDVQVIILTGHGSEKDEQEARRLGAFDYLQKPVDIDTLVGKIRKAYYARVERSFVAGAFAEAGEFDTARKIMEEKRDGNKDKE